MEGIKKNMYYLCHNEHKKTMRYFNTSGPNIPEKHYTLFREPLLEQGLQLVNDERYFTIWAPRQTGKSTYFRLLATKLIGLGYFVSHISLENYKDASLEALMESLNFQTEIDWNFANGFKNFQDFEMKIKRNDKSKNILIIDEVEGLNPEHFNQFLHTIRNLYHFRDKHCLKSVILVGVNNILGIVQDNASWRATEIPILQRFFTGYSF